MALKKCYKLHKVFLAELERCQRLDREGSQVLSSLANVAARVPLLSSSSTSSSSLGVLAFMDDAPALLLQKHFLAMEKSTTFLRDVVKDLVDSIRRLRGFVDEFADLVDEGFAEGDAFASKPALQMLEWMENVRNMYARDALRKRLLVADLEYQDVARLKRMHREWPASSSASYVDVDYIRRGTEVLPPLPERSVEGEEHNEDAASAKSKKSKKKKAK